MTTYIFPPKYMKPALIRLLHFLTFTAASIKSSYNSDSYVINQCKNSTPSRLFFLQRPLSFISNLKSPLPHQKSERHSSECLRVSSKRFPCPLFINRHCSSRNLSLTPSNNMQPPSSFRTKLIHRRVCKMQDMKDPKSRSTSH